MRAKREVHDDVEYIIFRCPGCKTLHSIDTNGQNKWTWNGSLERPTFSPSVLNWLEHRADENEKQRRYVDSRRCHCFVRNGCIEFLSDSGHTLAGQTVDLPEMH